ncbi:alpha/beta fold hydrolase [Leptodesmis sp.]|uniref:alpha/beta fold hydrolase n=1 Tax=Leptodesmis sp. TaxID=3100501 RepID=UPI003D0BA044
MDFRFSITKFTIAISLTSEFVFPDFLPADTALLSEAASIALAQNIQRQPIQTSLASGAIATTYVHQGTGHPPMLLLHGFDSSVLEFRRLQPLLAKHCSTWAIDLLGFGFTDRPSKIPFTPEAIKTHLYYTWKALIGEPVILIGASMGGAVAIDFALTYPQAVQQLVLIDSAGFAKGPDISKLMIPPLGYLATEFLRRPGVRHKVSLRAYHDPSFVTPDAQLCGALHLQHPNWNQALVAFTKSGGYNFLANKISQIKHPTLILWGDADQILGTADAEKFQQAIAGSHLVWIGQCGHVPHLEQPQTTAEVILKFVR